MPESSEAPVRIAFVAMPNGMVGELARRIAATSPRFAVAALEETGDAIAAAAGLAAADVLVLGLSDCDVPALCKSLLATPPIKLVVGIANDARHVAYFVGDPGPSELLATIRAALSGGAPA